MEYPIHILKSSPSQAYDACLSYSAIRLGKQCLCSHNHSNIPRGRRRLLLPKLVLSSDSIFSRRHRQDPRFWCVTLPILLPTICECITETSCCPVGTSQEQIGVDISNMASDILSMASIDPGIDIDLELGLQQPRRSHQSHRYLYRPRAHRDEVLQQTEASMTQVTSIAIAEPCTDTHSKPPAVGTDNMRFTGISGGHESIFLQKRVPSE